MSETARRASVFLADDEKFGRAHVWQYVQGRSLPRFKYLEALSSALQVKLDELVPTDVLPEYLINEQAPSARSAGPEPQPEGSSADFVHVRDYGDGSALLEVRQRVSWETALNILQILKASGQ